MKIASALVTLLLALALTGCVPIVHPEPTPTATPTPSATPVFPTVDIVDGGKRDGASGSALRDVNGNISRYFVATGDSASSIIQRFGLDLLEQLVKENGKVVRYDSVIYAQETLTLIPNSELEGTLAVADGGPITGALGPVTLDAQGRPLTYTVVEGDSADLIRTRFDIWWDQLADDEGLRLAKYPTLYIGQLLTFTGSVAALKEEKP